MSGNRHPGQNPEDDIFADAFGSPPEPPPQASRASGASKARGSGTAEPQTVRSADADAFTDIPESSSSDRGPGQLDEETFSEDEEPPPKKGNALLSNLITYGGAAALLVGGGFLIESQMGISRMILGETDPPAIAQTTPPVAPPPTGPRAPTTLPSQDPQGLRLPPPTVQAPVPTLPNQAGTQASNLPAPGAAPPQVGINRPPQVAGGTQIPSVGVPGTQSGPMAPALIPPVASMTIPQPAASQTPPLEIQVALNSAVDRMQDNQREAQRQVALGLQTGLNQIAMSVMTRFDRFEGRLDTMRASVESMGDRLGTLEGRIVALEATCATPPPVASAPSQPAPPPVVAQPAPNAVRPPQNTAAQPPAIPTRPQSAPAPQPQAATQPTPAPAPARQTSAPVPSQTQAPANISGWSLRGVSQNAALLQTPNGQLQRVELGEDVRDIGTVREIRREGDSFVVITSRGAIRP